MMQEVDDTRWYHDAYFCNILWPKYDININMDYRSDYSHKMAEAYRQS